MLDDAELKLRLDKLLSDCDAADDENRTKREKALDYFNGEMARHIPSDEGRSSMTSKDVRAVIKKVMPALKRTILGSDQVVEYKPIGPEDEQSAKDATTFVNKVVIPESRIDDAIADAILSALIVDEGILTWFHEEKKRVTVSYHSGQTPEQMAALEQTPDVEILDVEPYEVDVMGMPETMYRARIKRIVTDSKVVVKAVPLEDLIIHPDTTSEEDAPIIGHKFRQRRTDLVAMGYDRALVEELPTMTNDPDLDDDRDSRDPDRATSLTTGDGIEGAMEEIEVCRVFVRMDLDDDGIAELREIHYVRDSGESEGFGILFNDYADEVCYAIAVVERVLHSYRGVSIYDDVGELQTLKTVLTRQLLDNLYASNNPQPYYQQGSIVNPEAITSPQFGNPIRVKQGVSVNEALQWRQVPFFAEKTLPMLQQVDAAIVDRTGITSAASSLDPNALRDVREQGVEMISDAAAAQAWCMAREIAKGALTRMFKGVLKLVVQHQDKPRQVHINGQWQPFDPRSWNAELDCTVNVGLGTGTRESDLRALTAVSVEQEKIIKEYGGDNPFVTPVQYARTKQKIVEAIGLPSPDMYFTVPQEGTPFKPPQGPSPEEIKAQMQMQLEQVKQASARDKEMAQAEADIATKQADQQMKAQEAMFKADLDKVKSDDKLAFERQAHADKMALEWAKLNASAGVERGQINPETGETTASPMETMTATVAALAEQVAMFAQVAAMPRKKTAVAPNGKVYEITERIDATDPMTVN